MADFKDLTGQIVIVYDEYGPVRVYQESDIALWKRGFNVGKTVKEVAELFSRKVPIAGSPDTILETLVIYDVNASERLTGAEKAGFYDLVRPSVDSLYTYKLVVRPGEYARLHPGRDARTGAALATDTGPGPPAADTARNRPRDP